MENSTNEQLLLDRPAAAKLLGISVGTLINMEGDGRITPIRIGKRGRRYSVEYLREWIRQELRGAGDFRL